jgi:hypothetical protein
MFAHLLQINFLAQRGAESRQRLLRIVLLAIEAT